MNSVAWLVTSLQIQDSNNADVLLDSGLNLFDIMANLCSKLHYKVLLKSGNYIVYLLKWTSDLDFNTCNTVSGFTHSNWIMLFYCSSPKHKESAS